MLEKRKGTKWSYSQGDKCRHAGHLSREWRLWSGTLRSSSPACSNRMCLIKRDPSSRDTLPAGNPVVSDKGIWEKEELESEIGSRKYNDEQRRALEFRTNCNGLQFFKALSSRNIYSRRLPCSTRRQPSYWTKLGRRSSCWAFWVGALLGSTTRPRAGAFMGSTARLGLHLPAGHGHG